MADVLGVGPDRPRRRRPRWLTAAVGIAAAAVLGTLAVTVDRPEPTRRPEPVAPFPEINFPAAPPAVAEIAGADGVAPPAQVLVGGRYPGRLDLVSGRFLTLGAELRMGDGDTAVLARGAGFVAATVVHPRDEPAWGFLLTGTGGTVALGEADQVLPSRDGGVLTLSCAGACRLAARGPTGAVRWQRPAPAGTALVADTAYGLLTLVRRGEQVGALSLRDVRTGRELRRLGRTGAVLAVSAELVAFQELDCEPGCPLLVVRLADGAARRIPMPEGQVVAGAFAPDGRRIALGVAGLLQVDPFRVPGRSGYAIVADLATRTWVPVPGLRTAAGVAPIPLWLPDRLLLAAGIDGWCRFATWRPGDAALTVLPHRLPATVPGPADLGPA